MPSQEQRKHPRRKLVYPAVIVGEGGRQIACKLSNASQEGAQIHVKESGLPDQFLLVLNHRGAVKRRCRVIWRSGQQVGVQFIKRRRARRPGSGAALRRRAQAG